MSRWRIGWMLALTLGAGCLETAEPQKNDGDWVPPPSVPGTPDAGSMGVPPGPGPVTPGPGGTVDGGVTPGPGPVVGVDGGSDAGPGGNPADDGGGSPVDPPPVSAYDQIAGTGTSCTTYGLPANGKCGGIYCGIDLTLLSSAFAERPDRPNGCGAVPADLVCSGLTARTVAACARREKSADPLLTNPELRPRVAACAYEQAEIQAKMPESCLSCYLDSATCSGDNCLIECLGGDSPTCDKCRLDKGCSLPVADCTGFPNPL